MNAVELRPSSAERWTNCTGSASLIAASGKGETQETAHTIEGTNAHSVFEAGVIAMAKRSRYDYPSDEIYKVCEETANRIYDGKPPEHMVGFVVDAINDVRMYCNGFYRLHDLEIETEVFLDLSWAGIEGLKGGTCDLLITHRVAGDIVRLGVFDLKYGFKEVEAEDNPQLLLYAAAALKRAKVRNPIHVHLQILQPRILAGMVCQSWTTESNLVNLWFAEEAQPAAFAASNGTGKLVTSEKACRWCPAKAVCPALRQKLQWMGVVDMATTSPSEKAEIISLYSVITDLVDTIKADVQQELLDGSTDYEGEFKLVRKPQRRFFSEENQVVLRGAVGEKAFVSKPKTLKEVQGLLSEAGYDADDFLRQNTCRTAGGVTLALASDRRRAVDPSEVQDNG